MSAAWQLWLCVGMIYMIAISDRSSLKGADFLPSLVVECIWAFALVAPAFVGAVYALRDIWK